MNIEKEILSIVIINLNNFPDTVNCLQALFSSSYSNFKVFIIDNGSTDGSPDKIAQWLEGQQKKSSVQLVKLNSNLGFAGGNNRGMEEALKSNPDYIMLLNNDTIVPADFLEKFITSAQKLKALGLMGVKTYCYPQKDKVWYSGGQSNYWLGYGYHQKDDFKGIRETGFVTGCTMLFPTEVIKKVGLMDEKYFLNFEDNEYSQRIKKAGYKVLINGDTHIYHKVSSTQGPFLGDIQQYFFHRNRMIFFMEQLTGIRRLIFFVSQILIIIPGWLLIQLLHGRFHIVKVALVAYRDYFYKKQGDKGHWR